MIYDKSLGPLEKPARARYEITSVSNLSVTGEENRYVHMRQSVSGSRAYQEAPPQLGKHTYCDAPKEYDPLHIQGVAASTVNAAKRVPQAQARMGTKLDPKGVAECKFLTWG